MYHHQYRWRTTLSQPNAERSPGALKLISCPHLHTMQPTSILRSGIGFAFLIRARGLPGSQADAPTNGLSRDEQDLTRGCLSYLPSLAVHPIEYCRIKDLQLPPWICSASDSCCADKFYCEFSGINKPSKIERIALYLQYSRFPRIRWVKFQTNILKSESPTGNYLWKIVFIGFKK